MFDVDRWFEQYKEEQRIRCPYCNYDISNDSDLIDLYESGVPITYHGWPEDDSIKSVECTNCEKEFKVREHVRRTYDTCKIDEEISNS